jgi:ubiquinone/menaquinone biosynthesis C-methylase UbiE
MVGSDTGFTGSIPQIYDRYLGSVFFEPFAADLAARLDHITSGRVLEVAAGTGIATAAILACLPEGVSLVATDLNQAMLDYAKTKPELERVQWQQADGLALPFEDEGFDAVACQFGVMFFPDRVAGFREMHRVLKPGGLLVFNVWDRLAANLLMQATVDGLARRYPHHPSWFLERIPCGYRNPDEIRADLAKAGFTDCRIEIVRKTARVPGAREAAIGQCQGTPMRAEIESLDPCGLETATEAAANEIARHFGEGPFTVDMQALVVETRK